MSGPKVSVYTLTPEQIAILEERRKRRELEMLRRRKEQEEMRRKKQELKRLKKEISDTKPTILSLIDDAAVFEQRANEWQIQTNDSSLVDCIAEVRQTANELSKKVELAKKQEDIPTLETLLLEVKEKANMMNSKLSELKEKAAAVDDKLGGMLDKKAEGLFDLTQPAPSPQQHKEDELVTDMRKKLADSLSSDYLPAMLINEVRRLLNRLETANPSVARSVVEIEAQPLLERCEDYSRKWNEYGQEYRELVLRYETLIQMNGHQAEMKVIPFSEQAVQELKQLISSEVKYSRARAEQEYIVSTLNEVMTEMGYDVWGRKNITKKSGKSFTKSLYHYGEDSAINVTCTDNGQITMELGAVDTKDRLPSDEETSLLTDRMVSFCEDFTEIERKLEARGVLVSNRIAMAPPSALYAQVINCNDYDLVPQEQSKKATETRRAVKQKLERKINTGD